MRRILTLLLLCSLLLSACGPGEDDDGPLPGLDTTAVPQTSATNGPNGQITISFAAWDYEIAAYEPLAKKFHDEHPNITVALIPLDDLMDSNDSATSQLRRIVSGADTTSSTFFSPEVISANYVLNLTPLMDADGTFSRDDFVPGVLNRVTFDNNTYVLPRFTYVQLVSYNKDLFKAANLPEPKPDWTWNDLLGNAEQIASSVPNAYGYADYSGGFMIALADLQRTDSKLFSTPLDQVDLTQPELVNVLEGIQKKGKDKVFFVQSQPSGKDQPPTDPTELIRSGKVAMWPAEMLGISAKQSGEELSFGTGLAPLPSLSLNVQNTSTEGYIISAGTQHPQESWEWIEFLSRQPIGTDQSGSTPDVVPGRIPARTSLATAINYWDSMPAESRAAYEAALALPVTSPATQPDYTLFGPLSQAVYEVTSGGKKPAEALKTAQQQLKDQLAQVAQATATPKPDTGPIVVATPAPQTAPEGATALTFDISGFQASTFRKLARAFEQKNPQYYIEIKSTQMMTRPMTLSDMASGSDCFAWWGTPSSEEDFNALLDLQPLFDGDATFSIDDFPVAIRSQFSNSKGLYGLPYSFNVRNLSYNKKLFGDAGLKEPTASWTPEDFLSAAKALTKGSGAKKVYGYVPTNGVVSDMFFFVNQFGGNIARGSGRDTRPAFDDPNTVKAIQWYIDLAKTQGVMPEFKLPATPQDQFEDKSYEIMQDGRAGMWFDYGSGVAIDARPGPGSDNIDRGVAPLPVGAKGLQTGDLYARGYYISAKSEQTQGCWEWLKFLSSDQQNLNGDFPARTSLATSAEFQSSASPSQLEIYNLYADALKRTSSNGPGINALYAVNQFGMDMYWFSKAINDAIDGKADLATGLKTATELTSAHIDCVNKTNKPATCAKEVDPTYNGYNTQDPDPNQPVYAAG